MSKDSEGLADESSQSADFIFESLKNAEKRSGEPTAKTFSLSTNKPGNKILVGHSTGFSIIDSDTLGVLVKRDFGAGIGKIAMVESSNVIAFSGGGFDPKCKANELIIWDEEKQEQIAKIELASRVTGIQMTKKL